MELTLIDGYIFLKKCELVFEGVDVSLSMEHFAVMRIWHYIICDNIDGPKEK